MARAGNSDEPLTWRMSPGDRVLGFSRFMVLALLRLLGVVSLLDFCSCVIDYRNEGKLSTKKTKKKMSTTYGELFEKIVKTLNRANDIALQARVAALIRQHYYAICARHSWENLRRTIEVDMSAAESDGGVWLPTHLIGIDRVRTEDGLEILPKDRFDLDAEDAGIRYSVWRGADAPLWTGVVDIVHGSSTFAPASVMPDVVGQYIEFETAEYFLIVAPNTLDRTYWGPTYHEAVATVRPVETKKIGVFDDDERPVKSGKITIYGWFYPPQLWRDSDRILLPDAAWLELLVLRDLPEARERRPVAAQELEAAKTQCYMLNSDIYRDRFARDVKNRKMRFGSGMYGVRR